jgi:serine/threonine-protein kinase
MEARSTLGAGMQVTPNVRLVKQMSAGGMGSVWLAEHTGLKTRVVVKFMLSELGSSKSAQSRFRREAEAAAKVKSPHVVTMHDHGLTDDGVPFIVMEYLEGRDLGAHLTEKGKLEPRQVYTIIAQVSKALAKVHAAGLLHRDIKPDNIFLVDSDDDEIFVKLLDFGIAKSHTDETRETTLDGETKTGQVVGTPFYMSPEQVTAQKTIDLRSDLWALGVVTYEALTGTRPYDGPSFGALAVKIATGDPDKPTSANPDLPPGIDAWFAKVCARDASARYANAKELAEGLRLALGEAGPESAIMSDSGPRPMSKSGPGASVPPRSFTPPKSATTPKDGELDRPSFVLASTMEQPETSKPPAGVALGKSAPGMSIGESKPETRKGPPPFAYAIGVVLVVIGVVAGVTWSNRSKPNDPPPAQTTAAARPSAPDPPRASVSETPSASTAATTTTPDAAVTTPAVTTKPTFARPPVTAPPRPSVTPSARPTSSGGDPLF